MPLPSDPFWTVPEADLLAQLDSSTAGLTDAVSATRLSAHGPNRVHLIQGPHPGRIFARQFTSPLVLILIGGALLSLILRQWVDASIIIVIVLGSAVLGFIQEWRASLAIAALRDRLGLMVTVRRDGRTQTRPAEELVPGDIVLLSAGKRVPADGRVLESLDCFVEQASLTGESFPVEKQPGTRPADTPLAGRSNVLWAGTSVRSGTATLLVTTTGAATVWGSLATGLARPAPETRFQRGLRDFGTLLLRVMVTMVIVVLALNHGLGRPVIEALLFAVALAVGLSPELLPAIVSVTLARGARTMAARGTLVRRLESIENLGGLTVLCTDKTGTLTQGQIELSAAVDCSGQPSYAVLEHAWRNAALQTGIDNPLDAAIIRAALRQWPTGQLDSTSKIAEIPYDFGRRRLSVVVADPEHRDQHWLISKGAVTNLFDICTQILRDDREQDFDATLRAQLTSWCAERGAEGLRVLALAGTRTPARATWQRSDEHSLTLYGFLLFRDPPRPDAAQTLASLAELGIKTTIITGDNRWVAQQLARTVGLHAEAMLTGQDLAHLNDHALAQRAPLTSLFVEVDPQQKARIVAALQRAGHSVGYLGDGINDAPALHQADVGISVDGAVDIARESADVVLLSPDLSMLHEGIMQGRRTFANTMKYIAITTSANFGNMLSMAIAVPWLPFLPLAAKQILLNNFLSDLPALTLANDRVDPPQLMTPQYWDMTQVRRFMISFGLISTVFDLLTFALLHEVFHAPEALFQTAWFVVSLLTEVAVVLVLRTHTAMLRSAPSPALLTTTAAVGLLAVALPIWPAAAALFDFVPMPPALVCTLLAVVLAYLAATEWAKRAFWRQANASPSSLSR